MNQSDVMVYGANWCEDTASTRSQLDGLKIPYQYIDVDQNPQAKAWVKEQNGGKQKTPTVNIRGRILSEPDENELMETLRDAGLVE